MTLCLPLLLGAGPLSRVDVRLDGLRSAKGSVLACLTRAAATFPRCERDPHAVQVSLPAARAGTLSYANLPSGRYAIALFHDENDNKRLDTMLAIPREGFGFSRNPAVTFGAPSFAKAQFAVSGPEVREAIRVKYFL